MKCALCKNEAERAEYGKITVKACSKIIVLDESVKNKRTLLHVTLCKTCTETLAGDITARILGHVNNENDETRERGE